MSTSTKKTLTTPKGFTGDWDTALLWLYKVDAYFEANATIYVDDASKIYLILGLCEDRRAVQKWAEGEYSGQANLRAQDAAKMAAHNAAIIAHNAAVAATTATGPYTGQAPTPSDWLTYDNFIVRFRTRWILSNNGMEAITKIARMKQTGSVTDYNSAFVTVAYNTGLNNNTLIPYYRMGLKSAMLMRILSSEMFVGNMIQQWIDKATAVDDIWHIAMGNKAGGGNNSSKQRKRRDNNMDVDTVKTTKGKGKGKGISKDKRDRLRSEGRCFQCEGKYEPGHMCQKKKEARKAYNDGDKPTRSVGSSNNDQLVAKLQRELATIQKQIKANETDADRFETVEESEEDAPKKKPTKSVKRKWPKKKVESSDVDDEDFSDDCQ
jgi:hypothetical protein